MQCFVTAAKLSNFTKAAEQLYISQSALSQSIKRLENELGVELFKRDGNTVSLTHAGRVFLPEANSIIERTRMLREQMSELAESQLEQLNFVISTFYSRYFLPLLACWLEKHYPLLHINFIEDISIKLEDMLVGGLIDCCLVPLPCVHSRLEAAQVRRCAGAH